MKQFNKVWNSTVSYITLFVNSRQGKSVSELQSQQEIWEKPMSVWIVLDLASKQEEKCER